MERNVLYYLRRIKFDEINPIPDFYSETETEKSRETLPNQAQDLLLMSVPQIKK